MNTEGKFSPSSEGIDPLYARQTVGHTNTRDKWYYAGRFFVDILGLPIEALDDLNTFTAFCLDRVWAGHEHGWELGRICGSRNSLEFDQGIYPVNFPTTWSMSRFNGKGTAVAGTPTGVERLGLTPGQVWSNQASHLYFDHPNYPEWAKSMFGGQRMMFLANNAFAEPFSNWQETADISNVRIDMNSWNCEEGVICHGVYAGTTGENWSLAGGALTEDGVPTSTGHLYIHNATGDGIHIAHGAGPGIIGQVSSFDNHGAGVHAGSTNSLQNLFIVQLSCDNNDVNLNVPNGGSVGFHTMKDEVGLSESRQEPKRAGVGIRAAGWFSITGQQLTAHSANGRAESLIEVDHTNGARSGIKIDSIEGHAYNKLFVGKVGGVIKDQYDFQDYAVHRLDWTSDGQGHLGNNPNSGNFGGVVSEPCEPVDPIDPEPTDPPSGSGSPSLVAHFVVRNTSTVADISTMHSIVSDHSLYCPDGNHRYFGKDGQGHLFTEDKMSGFTLSEPIENVRILVVNDFGDDSEAWQWLCNGIQKHDDGNYYLNGVQVESHGHEQPGQWAFIFPEPHTLTHLIGQGGDNNNSIQCSFSGFQVYV